MTSAVLIFLRTHCDTPYRVEWLRPLVSIAIPKSPSPHYPFTIFLTAPKMAGEIFSWFK
jgi:hypothetical protein